MKWRQAREDECEKATIGFGFAPNWLRMKAIANRSEDKPKQKAELLSTFNLSIEMPVG